ncbi:MAG: aminotransferase class III-fold pyridoxal phosphate-dependent enzyme [Bacillati bacterium ANGP1]|uniref:Aminotransferase class III-fold pyridoxal phosphate-dependent enzyme n=1 Tax=Candidatus Segetimicrobium genomatis TaxID=2569760 RepID=A0A537KEC0_9BACT|nr:MAG: aminotransferase class III-fold pyridoxal phosphate-dependent enzyme [Terrabacteria group bacterium ANGP1]
MPDIIVCAKGLGAGYVPVGAVIAHERIGGQILSASGQFIHGHTYAGNPLACAAAAAVLEYVQTHGLVAAAGRKGEALRRELEPLRAFRGVEEVRGLGLMWGIEFAVPPDHPAAAAPGRAVVEAAFRNGLLVYPAGGSLEGSTVNQILVGPPLTIADAEIAELGGLLRRSVREALA